jgi:hypothetical protein
MNPVEIRREPRQHWFRQRLNFPERVVLENPFFGIVGAERGPHSVVIAVH